MKEILMEIQFHFNSITGMRIGQIQSIVGLTTILSKYEVSLNPNYETKVSMASMILCPEDGVKLYFKKIDETSWFLKNLSASCSVELKFYSLVKKNCAHFVWKKFQKILLTPKWTITLIW